VSHVPYLHDNYCRSIGYQWSGFDVVHQANTRITLESRVVYKGNPPPVINGGITYHADCSNVSDSAQAYDNSDTVCHQANMSGSGLPLLSRVSYDRTRR
jgi:hypothetical protein